MSTETSVKRDSVVQLAKGLATSQNALGLGEASWTGGESNVAFYTFQEETQRKINIVINVNLGSWQVVYFACAPFGRSALASLLMSDSFNSLNRGLTSIVSTP